jgi:hypothetical protein
MEGAQLFWVYNVSLVQEVSVAHLVQGLLSFIPME